VSAGERNPFPAEEAAMTHRIREFLSTQNPPTPCLVVDLDVIEDNYHDFRTHLPDSDVFYAVKANPEREVLALLERLGSSFDCASVAEIEMALATGADAGRISFGNTIKKERDIARAFALGVRMFAIDCVEEAEKVARAAPGTNVFCRILTEGKGAEWPLSRKFGCVPDMAVNVLVKAHGLGLRAVGVSFHVGSQMTDPLAWDDALAQAKQIFDRTGEAGIRLELVNLGGGFPARYLRDIPAMTAYGEGIRDALARHFGNDMPRTIIEPGRGMVGNSGIIRSEVVLVSRKSDQDEHRWVYLDIGKFGGLAETMDEAIRYSILTPHCDLSPKAPCVLAGPTCDSADVLYEKTMYPMPESLAVGDEVLIEGTGAYTTTYSSVAFNGFDPLKTYVI
jgi:ornithine decarboxylase